MRREKDTCVDNKWRAGVNGLGVWGIRWLPYKQKFDIPACAHDKAYDVGGDQKDRLKVDKNFLRDMLPLCVNRWQLLWAGIYYHMVRIFGWAFFRYD